MLPRIIVSRQFRALIQNTYGFMLGDDIAKWRLMECMLFGTRVDPVTGGVIAGTDILAAIEGKEQKARARHYNGEAFLTHLKAEGMKFDWWRHNVAAGRSRVLKPYPLPLDVQRAIVDELSHPLARQGAVYFDTGQPFDAKARRAETRRQQTAIQRQVAAYAHNGPYAGVEPAQHLLAYMNDLPSNRFTGLLQQMDMAYAAVDRITTHDPDQQARLQHQQRCILRNIESQPQPFYRPVERSVRIFGAYYNITGLKREVRHALTQGWYEVDLKQSQLAICAASWPIPQVQTFLAQGRRIWSSLFEHFGLGETPEVKDIFKDALYGTLFGMSEESLQSGSRKRVQGQWFTDYVGLDVLLGRYGVIKGGAHFLAHPLIGAILVARAAKMQAVIAAGGLETIFGQWIEVMDDASARSALVQEAQAMEMALLAPVIEQARHTKEWSITLWQHDGFSLSLRDQAPARARALIKRLRKSVDRAAAKYGIITTLEVKDEAGAL
ncbi:hypothetical protein EKD04_014385 [Chloroflexales bacterium ZM16-3]|nr:hypothetical protein [Chloroflexales bacterium ZM16-3]